MGNNGASKKRVFFSHPSMEIEKKYLLLSGIVEKVDTIEKKEKERERNRDRIIIQPGLSRIDRGERIDRWLFIKRTMNLFARAQWIRMEYINWNNYTRHLLNFT